MNRMKFHKKTGLPLVDDLDCLRKAAEEGYMFVHAKCPKCGKYWLSIIPNAELVLTKGCPLCRSDEEQTDWNVGLVVKKR